MARPPDRGAIVTAHRREEPALTIGAASIADMLAHAREAAPRECCGLLIGTGLAVRRPVRATNVHPQPTRYLIDPDDHFTAIRLARAEGLEVIGAYHSHPSNAPVPSQTDIAEADSGGDFLYVIVSLLNDEVKAYRILGGVVSALDIQVGN